MAHRRAGKTVATIYDLIDAALRCDKPDGRFAYVAPYYAQAKDVVWMYVKRAASPVPGVKIHESEMYVEFPNKARVKLYGADNYDRMRGLYFDGVVLDEYADMPPAAWSEVIRPALSDRKGWAAFIGTPKGRNSFAALYERAEKDDEWFTLRLRASESGLIAPEELEALKLELSRNEYQREMETDFDAAIEGAYYAECIDATRKAKRIRPIAPDPILPVYAAWDLGVSDSTTIWLFQVVDGLVHIIDYIEATGQPLAYYVNEIRSRQLGHVICILPHDSAQRDKFTASTYEDHIKAAGFETKVIANQGRGAAMQRVEAARRVFPSIVFNETEAVQSGIEALASYHERRDEKRGVGLGPEHDWSSHAADSFGLLCVAKLEGLGYSPSTVDLGRFIRRGT